MKKNGTDGEQQVWRKLHLVADTNMHEIIATELSTSNITGDEVLPNLLKQTHREINAILADSAYDTRQYHETVRIK
ncbi:Mobile element protein [Candidatus Enterovibrio altilux]|uniref:Mobile element protein n=1 Tax=Candidatus Enterovibrio altilux TaxID=1927128 RepID=A0A291B7E4_9GAMM|nr:Mobile element protein [Candidatus Enterovibrio luxaltus]